MRRRALFASVLFTALHLGAHPSAVAASPAAASEVVDDSQRITDDDEPIIIEDDEPIVIEDADDAASPGYPAFAMSGERTETQSTQPRWEDFIAVSGALQSRAGTSLWLPPLSDPWRGIAEARFAIDLRPRFPWRFHVDGWARGTGRAALPSSPLTWRDHAVVDADTVVTDASAELGEAYMRMRVPKGSLTLGRQVFSWSRNDLTRLGDVINPPDTRAGLLFPAGYSGRLAVFALAGRILLGEVALQAAWVPLFEPPRVRFFASDVEAVEPGAPPPALAPAPRTLGLDALARPLADTREAMIGPRTGPSTGEVAVRASGTAGGVDLGAQIFAGYDRTAALHTRPAMAAALGLAHDGLRPLAAAATLRQLCPAPARAGGCVPLGDLVQLEYQRTLIGQIDGATTLGPAVLKAELMAVPKTGPLPGSVTHLIDTGSAQLFSDTVSKLATAISLESGYGEWIQGSVEVVDVAYLNIAEGRRVARVEPATEIAAEERTVHRFALGVALSGALLDRDLLWRCAAMASPLQRDYALAPRLSYRTWLGQELALGAELIGGPAGTFGGFYEAASRLYFEWSLAF